MAAFWLIAGLAVATISGVGTLILGASVLAAMAAYIASGCLTLCLGLLAATLDDIEDSDAGTESSIIPAE